ncbi:unnamed protein product [Somion occarium]|uniref:Uncharacterized protein n=1 Tax=Somion occarium TaxID=3059160 RepID=A0ABP1E1J7_9APHY
MAQFAFETLAALPDVLPPTSPALLEDMLVVMPTPPRLSPSPSSAHKRPRGLWKGRRTFADTKMATITHDRDIDCEEDHRYDADWSYDDDLDDTRSSTSSGSKRRRISGAFSDFSCHSGSVSRALSPDINHASNPWQSFHLSSNTTSTDSPRATPALTMSSQTGKPQPSTTDLEDWENLKELHHKASDLYEADQLSEALPLLRAVMRECNRILTIHPDPSVIFAAGEKRQSSYSPVQVVTPTEERLHRDWGNETFEAALKSNILRQRRPLSRSEDLPTAFHAIFGITLFLLGNIVAQDPSLALPGEPSSAATYWLAALDVFETGESLPCLLDSRGCAEASEDWRMAIAWGRTLVCLAEEKISSMKRAQEEAAARAASAGLAPDLPASSAWAYLSSPGPFTVTEPSWPKDSPFYTIAVNRPPVTRRMSMYSATPHDILVLATDQFSRGIFHMPHPHHSYVPHPTNAAAFSSSPFDTSPPSLILPELSTSSSGSSTSTSYFHQRLPSALPPSFSRPKELFTIGSEVLGVAERLSSTSNREYWAKWADSVFNQMKMEADIDIWRGPVTRARGRCWLVMGSARAEELEEALERGEMHVLSSEDAEEARDALSMAIAFFERAKGSASLMEEDAEDVSPLLAEALLTLANLTIDENKREELYCRAQTEGGEEVASELQLMGLGPPMASSMSTDTVMMDVN